MTGGWSLLHSTQEACRRKESKKSKFHKSSELARPLAKQPIQRCPHLRHGQLRGRAVKALFVTGLVVLILGIASFFVPIPHTENHGIKAGDVSIGVRTTEHERVSPIVSTVLILAGAGMMIGGRGRS